MEIDSDGSSSGGALGKKTGSSGTQLDPATKASNSGTERSQVSFAHGQGEKKGGRETHHQRQELWVIGNGPVAGTSKRRCGTKVKGVWSSSARL
jgi:hypothetical protein